MEQVAKVSVLAGRGIVGDRYGAGIGSFSKKRPEIRALSLIAEEAIVRANIGRMPPFLARETRRNLVVSVSPEMLNSLLNEEFAIGEVPVRGVELCDPCTRPSMLCGKVGFKEAFAGMGGLRVIPLNDGEITRSAPILLAA